MRKREEAPMSSSSAVAATVDGAAIPSANVSQVKGWLLNPWIDTFGISLNMLPIALLSIPYFLINPGIPGAEDRFQLAIVGMVIAALIQAFVDVHRTESFMVVFGDGTPWRQRPLRFILTPVLVFFFFSGLA